MKTSITALLLATAVVALSQSTVFEYPDGLTIKMNPNATRAGFNFGSLAGDPSSPQNGDAWYNSSTGKVKFYAGGSTLIIGEADLTQLNASNLTSGTLPDARFPATLPSMSGVNLTALNASNLASGTLPDARFPATLPALNGSALTALNAGNLASGTIPDARFPATLPALNGSGLTALNASNLASGTIPDARFPATIPAASGANLTALNASNLSSGTLPDARFPATLPALSGANLTALNASNIGSGTVPAARFPAFTGDATSTAGTVALTLATVNANVGSFGSSTAIPSFTVNAKGLITAASTNAVVAPAGTLTGTTLAANVTGSSLTGVGTITSGTWNASVIAGQYGGTGVNNAGKTLTLGGSYTINGTTGSTLDIGTGGTLGAAAFIGTSLGTNGATDDGKAAIFNTDGSLGASRYMNVLSANGRQMMMHSDDLTIYFQDSGWSDESGLVIPTDMGQDTLHTIATRQWANAAFTLTNLTGEVVPNTFLAGPDGGGNDNPSFRAIVDADLPAGISGNKIATGIDAGNISAGTLAAARGGAGTVNGVLKANGSGAVSAATAGTDYLTPGATQTVTATTLDSQAGTNVLKFLDEIELTNPHQVDGTGAVIDAVSTSPTYGHAIFSGSADKAANYVLYRFRVPFDLDTATDLQAALTVRLNAADTGKHAYEISMASVTSSASADLPTFTNAVALNFTGDASGASGDLETIAYTTLTSWRSSLTSGHIIVIKLARDGDDGTNDTSTVTSSDVSLTIKFGRTQ